MKTNNPLLAFLKKIYYPSLEIQLLQRAELAPISEARQAWEQWRDLDRLDDIGWQEQKILARMYVRIPQLDPHYPHLPRVIGFIKSEWTRSQLRLKESLVAIDLLLANKYNLMLFKGLAWDKHWDAKGIRISGDLDILVPENDFISALMLLEQNNWKTQDDTRWRKSGVIPKEVHALNYTNGKWGNIDLHRRPLYSDPGGNYLSGLWQRSCKGNFMGRNVRYCSHSDYLTLLIAHGVGSNIERNMSSIWPGDFHRAILGLDVQSIADFRSIILQIKKPLECEFALSYCREILYSDEIATFSRNIEAFTISTLALIRSILSSPPAFTRGTWLWLLAAPIRRTSRYASRIQNHLQKRSASLAQKFTEESPS